MAYEQDRPDVLRKRLDGFDGFDGRLDLDPESLQT